ncbi:MAG: TonB family protein [Armatimonadetes bacterium]|nr:TonB family protein [Armatimonadota bacterium]
MQVAPPQEKPPIGTQAGAPRPGRSGAPLLRAFILSLVLHLFILSSLVPIIAVKEEPPEKYVRIDADISVPPPPPPKRKPRTVRIVEAPEPLKSQPKLTRETPKAPPRVTHQAPRAPSNQKEKPVAVKTTAQPVPSETQGAEKPAPQKKVDVPTMSPPKESQEKGTARGDGIKPVAHAPSGGDHGIPGGSPSGTPEGKGGTPGGTNPGKGPGHPSGTGDEREVTPPPAPKPKPPPPPPPPPKPKWGPDRAPRLVARGGTPDIQSEASGTARVDILVGSQGEVIQVRLAGSSGDNELDQAALAMARGCRFEHGVANGEPARMWVTIPFSF